jgi:hypothetical protein
MKRNHHTTFHTRDPRGNSMPNQLLPARRFARLTTAVPRIVQLLLDFGQPGDVAEVAHAEFGFQIATIKVHVGGRIDIKWTIKE